MRGDPILALLSFPKWGLCLADDTRTFDPFYQRSLTEEVNDDQGRDDHHARGIADGGVVEGSARGSNIQGGRDGLIDFR